MITKQMPEKNPDVRYLLDQMRLMYTEEGALAFRNQEFAKKRFDAINELIESSLKRYGVER